MIEDITWRPYQNVCHLAIKNAKNRGVRSVLIKSATATGKLLMSLRIVRHYNRTLFIAHREELIMQAFDQLEQYYPLQVGIIKAERFDNMSRIVIASAQTLHRRLHLLRKNDFDYIIVDECFPAGTKIDGINIENFKVGHSINSFNHKIGRTEESIVTGITKREYKGKLYDLGHFTCTPKHPIFIVGIGYCLAKEIYYAYLCYKVICYGQKANPLSYLYKLQNRLHNKNWKIYLFRYLFTSKKKTDKKKGSGHGMQKLQDNIQRINGTRSEDIHAISAKRIWLLFRKMQEGIPQQDCLKNNGKDKQRVCLGKDEKEQSYVQPRNETENDQLTKGKNIFVSRWKWRTHKAAAIDPSNDETSNRIPNSNKKSNVFRSFSAKLLQSGSCLFGSKASNRNRWENPSIKALEILGQKKNGNTEKFRLEGIKIQKRGSRQKSGKSQVKNYVYNLEVAKNNNYFANSILVHNCHHHTAPSNLKSIRHFKPKLMTGWTATPKRMDGLSLSNIFEELVFSYGIEDGIKDGYLAKINGYQIRTQADLSQVRKQAGDFNLTQLSEKVDTDRRNQLIIDKYQEYSKGEQAIAYCVDIKHAIRLRNKFRENGIRAETIVSDESLCPNRAELLHYFTKGKIQVLTNCEILIEGWNYNDVAIGLMARPTQSETLYIQAIGRLTRLKSNEFKEKFGHDHCIVLDFVDNAGKHSLVNTYELEKDKPAAERIFLSEKDKEVAIKEEREKKGREIRMQVSDFKDRKLNMFKLPKIDIWSTWNPDKIIEPATEKQIAFLKKLNLWQENVEYTKGQCSELIGGVPAQYWQLMKLAGWGYDISKGATYAQFRKAEDKVQQKEKFKIEKTA